MKRIELFYDGAWRGPVRHGSNVFWDFELLWDDAGLKDGCRCCPPSKREGGVFVWTETGWANVGEKTLDIILSKVPHTDVRVVDVSGDTVYLDELQACVVPTTVSTIMEAPFEKRGSA